LERAYVKSGRRPPLMYKEEADSPAVRPHYRLA
jgi:hypothetical protein